MFPTETMEFTCSLLESLTTNKHEKAEETTRKRELLGRKTYVYNQHRTLHPLNFVDVLHKHDGY